MGLPLWQRLLCRVLRAGVCIPQHVAFIMDGNRRYAKREHVSRKRGHELGYKKLEEVLEWCLELGVKVVTVFAFSIENFRRDQSEVDDLLQLAANRFDQICREGELIDRHGVCVRVLGDLSLLPLHVQQAAARAMRCSQHQTRVRLNICFAYTSRHEIVHAVRDIATSVQSGELVESDVDADLLRSCLYTADTPPLDLLIRTSGEVRLSDFMLWQADGAQLDFVETLWPAFSPRDLAAVLLRYSMHRSEQLALRARLLSTRAHWTAAATAIMLAAAAGSTAAGETGAIGTESAPLAALCSKLAADATSLEARGGSVSASRRRIALFLERRVQQRQRWIDEVMSGVGPPATVAS